jgi:hypothetical protein
MHGAYNIKFKYIKIMIKY